MPNNPDPRGSMDLSLIVCAYNMDRELPRTIRTLGRTYQRDMAGCDYEIIVIDNGSARPVQEEALRQIADNVRVVRPQEALISPARAINEAVRACEGQLIGLFIDGARMASPGLLAGALAAYRSDPAKVIGSLAFHLGPDVQLRSVFEGYNQQVEDELLASIPWEEDGYTLFTKSVLALSSAQGWFGVLAESNGVILDRGLWERLGGLDERFSSPGGGLVNLDFWKRAVEASDNTPWIVLGEGTFHQVHGGAATNGTRTDREKMQAEYEALLGERFIKTNYSPRLIGTLERDLAIRFAGQNDNPSRTARQARGCVGRPGYSGRDVGGIGSTHCEAPYSAQQVLRDTSDIVFYGQLIDRLLPRTLFVIEVPGEERTRLLRDYCRSIGLDCQILALGMAPPANIEGVESFKADAKRPCETFPKTRLFLAEHPWLVVMDCANPDLNTWDVLEHLGPLLHSGDYTVLENGLPCAGRNGRNKEYLSIPNPLIGQFLDAHPGVYQLDTELMQYFGPSVIFCSNAWLLKL